MPRTPRLVVIDPSGSRREVSITSTPFPIGRQSGNELTIPDVRVSRQHAQLVLEAGKLFIEDLGSRRGTYINGERITGRRELHSCDRIDFGMADSYQLLFPGEEAPITEILERMYAPPPEDVPSRELYHLGTLLQVAQVLHTGTAMEDVLGTVVDAAIRVTQTERGVLLLCDDAGKLEPIIARDARCGTLRPAEVSISQSVLRQVLKTRRELIVTDTGDQAGLRQQESVVRLELRTVVAIPLEKLPMVGSGDTTIMATPSQLLGVLYLDSHEPGSAFSALDQEVLRSLAFEAATVVENSRLFAASRAKERLEHEMQIACEIQKRLLPKTFPRAEHFVMTGLNVACESVGGDYFDVIELSGGRYGLVVADVAGKGIPAALLASMLQGVFSATAGMDIALDVLATRVNRYLCERSSEDRYATLFYAVLQPDGRLEYVNAGHVSALVRTTLGQVYPLASDNFPLGMFDFAEYHGARVYLQPGDFLIVYSDGISEARNLRDELFGEHGLRDVLQRFSGETVEALSDTVLAAVREFTSGAPQSDDMTVVVAQYRGQPS